MAPFPRRPSHSSGTVASSTKRQIIRDDLWVRNGKILDPRKLFWEEKGYADLQVDCHDVIIAPGYIDVQINGEIDFHMAMRHELATQKGCFFYAFQDFEMLN